MERERLRMINLQSILLRKIILTGLLCKSGEFSTPLADGSRASARVLVVLSDSGANLAKLFHFPHVGALRRRIHETVSVAAHMVASHGRGSRVCSNPIELLHFVEDHFILRVLHFLDLRGIILVLVAHDGLHGCAWTIGPAKGTLHLVHIHCLHLILLLDGIFAGSTNPDPIGELAPHGILINASGDPLCSGHLVKSFKVLIINDWWLQCLLLIYPFRRHYTQTHKNLAKTYNFVRRRGPSE